MDPEENAMTTVVTNHNWRDLVCRCDVPGAVLKGDLNWTTETSPDWYFNYKNHWYHISEFTVVVHGSDLHEWHGSLNDSAWSGVVVRLHDDNTQVQVGRFYS
ncbi:MAG: hypothetical protein DRI24_17040 [Deltaproteobacteria bacterium]|nr:MAG: hypothetical protein DRI24_17040 [Deltaproteobacteria bacterium]